jgi:hypothetical protein
VVVHTDTRLTPINLGALHISFRKTAPSKLYWAGRPAIGAEGRLHLFRLPRHFAAERSGGTPANWRCNMVGGEVQPQHLSDRAHLRAFVGLLSKGLPHGLNHKRVLGREVIVEAAVGKSDLAHEIGHRDPSEPAFANEACGDLNDLLPQFLRPRSARPHMPTLVNETVQTASRTVATP